MLKQDGWRSIGSSPRTWGTRRRWSRCGNCQRFIPTHVGNTKALTVVLRIKAVHPHARGEHGAAGINVGPNAGSSPRTWGTLCRWTVDTINQRFIPTHVGNTPSTLSTRSPPAVHPHARGEHSAVRLVRLRYSGSSPRTWGTPIFPLVAWIPAGSSPRTWGTLCDGVAALMVLRFIPTHVGNTKITLAPLAGIAVHPHARGEHGCLCAFRILCAGSSPRTWGTLFSQFLDFQVVATPLTQHQRF